MSKLQGDYPPHPPVGQSDGEVLNAAMDFNLPAHQHLPRVRRSREEVDLRNTIARPQEGEEEGGEGAHDDHQASQSGAIAVNGSVCITSLQASSPLPLHPPPPDGGLIAWLQVLAGHLVGFNAWGYISAYGLFEAHYISTLHLSASALSWVGSVQIFLLLVVGTFSGRALDVGYYRHVLVAGCTLQLVGIFTTSLATQYWQLFLAQGICQGLGDGLVFAPTVSLVATYFSRHRSLALSFVTSGNAVGGVLFSVIAQQLLPRIGFPWTVRVMGLMVLCNVGVICTVARPRLPPRKTGPVFELAAFKEVPYTLFTLAYFLALWAAYYAYTYINIFATSIIHISSGTSLAILLLFNAVGLPGRVLTALVADHLLGPLNTLVSLTTSCGILFFTWAAVTTLPGLVVFVLVFGFVNAAVQGIFLSAASSLTVDHSKMGTRVGMIFSAVALATVTGPPIAGALIELQGGKFLGAQIFGGVALLMCTAVLVAARIVRTGWKVGGKM